MASGNQVKLKRLVLLILPAQDSRERHRVIFLQDRLFFAHQYKIQLYLECLIS